MLFPKMSFRSVRLRGWVVVIKLPKVPLLSRMIGTVSE